MCTRTLHSPWPLQRMVLLLLQIQPVHQVHVGLKHWWKKCCEAGTQLWQYVESCACLLLRLCLHGTLVDSRGFFWHHCAPWSLGSLQCSCRWNFQAGIERTDARWIVYVRSYSLGIACALCCFLQWGYIRIIVKDNLHLVMTSSFWVYEFKYDLPGVCSYWSSWLPPTHCKTVVTLTISQHLWVGFM